LRLWLPAPRRAPPRSRALPYTTLFRSRPLEQVIDRVLGFTDEARSLGLQPGARLLSAEVVAADEVVASALGLEPGATVLRLARRSEEHTSELQSRENLVCRLLLEKQTH